eukprot:gene781-1834_t
MLQHSGDMSDLQSCDACRGVDQDFARIPGDTPIKNKKKILHEVDEIIAHQTGGTPERPCVEFIFTETSTNPKSHMLPGCAPLQGMESLLVRKGMGFCPNKETTLDQTIQRYLKV